MPTGIKEVAAEPTATASAAQHTPLDGSLTTRPRHYLLHKRGTRQRSSAARPWKLAPCFSTVRIAEQFDKALTAIFRPQFDKALTCRRPRWTTAWRCRWRARRRSVCDCARRSCGTPAAAPAAAHRAAGRWPQRHAHRSRCGTRCRSSQCKRRAPLRSRGSRRTKHRARYPGASDSCARWERIRRLASAATWRAAAAACDRS